LEAADELGYTPNAIARGLVAQSTKLIALLFRYFNPFYAPILREFAALLQDQGYWPLLLEMSDDNDLEETLPMAFRYRVDGIIITSANLTSTLAGTCRRLGMPVVLFNRYTLMGGVNAVRCDNVAGGRMAADAILDGGAEAIAYLAGDEHSSTNRDREQGFVERLEEHGCSLTCRDRGDYTYESGYAAARRLLAGDSRPDGIFCACDMMALGVLDCARFELGIQVPEELRVVGFDGIQMAGWPSYSLTTLRQPLEEMIDSTIRVLLDAVETSSSSTIIETFPPTLIERSSTLGAAG
jgi:DNA-binding LacI/PurR family transcriptional regulator